jgi:hypothetical protein
MRRDVADEPRQLLFDIRTRSLEQLPEALCDLGVSVNLRAAGPDGAGRLVDGDTEERERSSLDDRVGGLVIGRP